MATLEHLPLALHLDIADLLDRRSLNALVRTSTYFYTGLNHYMYKLHIKNDDPHNSCLFWAAKVGQLNTFRMGHLHGADLNVTRPTLTLKEPPSLLHAAIKNLHPDIVAYIVQNGGAVHSPSWVYGNARGYPLGKALMTRNLKDGGVVGAQKMQRIVNILISHGAWLVGDGEPALPRAAAINKKQAVSLLLELPEVNVNDKTGNGWTALHLAAQNGHAEVTRCLLDQPGIDIHAHSASGLTALELATLRGHLEVVRQLLTWQGLTPEAASEWRKTAFFEALKHGHCNICEYLITIDGINGAMILQNNRTALHLAAISDNVDTVHLLLEHSTVDLGAVDGCGENVLHYLANTVACRGRIKRADVAKMLVERGADIDHVAMDGHTPLERAISTHNFDVATQLLHCGANPRVYPKPGSGDNTWTLLHDCLLPALGTPYLSQSRRAMIKALIRYDPASLNAESRVTDPTMRTIKEAPFDGTPLLFAVLYDREPGTIQMLLDLGARIDSIATKREADASNNRHSLLQALFSADMRVGCPLNRHTMFLTTAQYGSVRERLGILLLNGARIDNENGLQSVLQYACELQLRLGCSDILAMLSDMATLRNVSLDYVTRLADKYSMESPEGHKVAVSLRDWAIARLQ